MYVYARRTCSVKHGVRTVHVVGGDAWYADDPFVKAHRDLFADAPTIVRGQSPKRKQERPVEQATAAPGEKRTTKKTTPNSPAGD